MIRKVLEAHYEQELKYGIKKNLNMKCLTMKYGIKEFAIKDDKRNEVRKLLQRTVQISKKEPQEDGRVISDKK